MVTKLSDNNLVGKKAQIKANYGHNSGDVGVITKIMFRTQPMAYLVQFNNDPDDIGIFTREELSVEGVDSDCGTQRLIIDIPKNLRASDVLTVITVGAHRIWGSGDYRDLDYDKEAKFLIDWAKEQQFDTSKSEE